MDWCSYLANSKTEDLNIEFTRIQNKAVDLEPHATSEMKLLMTKINKSQY